MYVVGVDGSRRSAEALRWALAEAARTGSAVHAVRVWAGADAHVRDSDEHARHLELERVALDAAIGQVPARADVTSTRELRRGSPVRELVAAAEGADALVVGRSGFGGIGATVMGSVTRGCVAAARCPVVVVAQPEPDPPAGRVAVGVAEDEEALAAVEWAAAEARWRGAVLVGVRAYEGVMFADPDVTDRYERDLTQRVVEKAAYGVPVEYELTEGETVPSLLAAAARCDLLVVGTRTHGLLGGTLPTTVVRIVENAPVPVVVVRTA